MKDAQVVNPVLYKDVVQIVITSRHVMMICFVTKTIYHDVIKVAVNIVTKLCHQGGY